MLDYLPAILAAVMQQGVFNLNIDDYTVTDTENHQMWLYQARSHGERADAISVCNNLTFAKHSDWYLPNKAQSGFFHSQMNAENILPLQLFDRCTAEVVSDGYVRTKRGAETYGGNPGDPINFSGGANIRCVRDL
ncbi:MAG: DUF1566 domain-containing protein [gamma proteobacterium symbiont of Lucinoma myriamae]|nr:DUF1566 domain-containing protein [gamma proteobacterium symbiont of Lucinoma myriamae]MCU7820016.1 DUF1566 domain-containing protein [gamma proteobacterium symbiont of Lucinoma myriamae]MCU7831381.1 DUF1566 domain-containing protein [gamma proteobacterium symbiont of Lucinoma myriamae]